MAEAQREHMSYADYLALESASEVKHEYLRGEIFAMAGGTPRHSALAMAVGVELSIALAERSCVVFNSDLRVRIETTDLSTYPDVVVVCGPLETAEDDRNAALNPVLIVEVLSDSTEAYDRGQKFSHYRQIPSLREYLLVAQTEPRLEAYAKNEAGRWELAEAGPGDVLTLSSLEGVELQVDRVYRPAAGLVARTD